MAILFNGVLPHQEIVPIMANVITKGFPNSDEDFSDSMCEHVEKDRTVAYRVYREDDTFGPVGRHVVCKECFEKEEDQPFHSPCEDCGQLKPSSEMKSWKWYDYYAPQGDEPLYICVECIKLPKHLERKRRDDEERQKEDDYYESRRRY